MNNDYELLETYTRDKETWSYLRHKKTGLEIAYHQCETQESGFSFCFRTPVEDQYLGTSHVLEHCVLTGSKKYDVDFWELQSFSLITSSNAFTDAYSTTFFFNSIDEAEVFKVIPILADYVFFPTLSEEAFMQEGFRVEFDKNGDIVSVVYNEMRVRPPETFCVGGIYYKLHELTNEKIREYHKKYYRPDNCLFSYDGSFALDDVLLQLNKCLLELEEKVKSTKILPRKNLTISEFLETVPFEQIPEKLENPEYAKWIISEHINKCEPMTGYWVDGLSPIIPFCLDEKYAYTAICWWFRNNKEFVAEPVPPKKNCNANYSGISFKIYSAGISG